MKTNLIRLAAAAVLYGASGAVLAFPCYDSNNDPLGYMDGEPTADSSLIPTDPDGAGNNYDCSDGAAGDKNDSLTDLNDGSHWYTDWVYLDRFETPGIGTGANGIISISNLYMDGSDILGGNWSLSGDLSEYTEIVIVLKDGKYTPPADGIYWSAYLIDDGKTSGDFYMATNNLSHITAYGRGGDGYEPPGETPIPAPIALLGLGTLLLALRGRKSLT